MKKNDSCSSFKLFVRWLLYGFSVERLYELSRSFSKKKWGGTLSRLIAHRIHRVFCCYLSPLSEVGDGLVLKHPVGIVIGEGVVIGDDVTLYQGVTLGAKKVGDEKRCYPVICDSVVVYAGATIVGGVVIGKGAVIGAGSVVVKDVPPFAVIVGNPGRIVNA